MLVTGYPLEHGHHPATSIAFRLILLQVRSPCHHRVPSGRIWLSMRVLSRGLPEGNGRITRTAEHHTAGHKVDVDILFTPAVFLGDGRSLTVCHTAILTLTNDGSEFWNLAQLSYASLVQLTRSYHCLKSHVTLQDFAALALTSCPQSK